MIPGECRIYTNGLLDSTERHMMHIYLYGWVEIRNEEAIFTRIKSSIEVKTKKEIYHLPSSEQRATQYL